MNEFNTNDYAYGSGYECNFMDRVIFRPREDVNALKRWLLMVGMKYLHPKVEKDYFEAYKVFDGHLPNKYLLVDQLYKKHGIPLDKCLFKFPESVTAYKRFKNTYEKLGWEYIE